MPSNNWQEIRLLTHDRYRTFNGGMFKTALSKLIGNGETHIQTHIHIEQKIHFRYQLSTFLYPMSIGILNTLKQVEIFQSTSKLHSIHAIYACLVG